MPLGLRLGDLILYFILALLIFGPQKLPEIGAAIGKTVSSFKNVLKGTTDGVEMDEDVDLREQQALEAKRLELQYLENAIAIKKLELRGYEKASTAEGSSELTKIEIPAN